VEGISIEGTNDPTTGMFSGIMPSPELISKAGSALDFDIA
jgi:hypothetical protein